MHIPPINSGSNQSDEDVVNSLIALSRTNGPEGVVAPAAEAISSGQNAGAVVAKTSAVAAEKIGSEPSEKKYKSDPAPIVEASPQKNNSVSLRLEVHSQIGKWTRAEGSIYEGESKDRMPHGKGKLSRPDGTVYEGDWQNGSRHGKGKLSRPDGTVYEGDWQNDNAHGKGKLSRPDRTIYEGGWQNGLRHGGGRETQPNGTYYEGGWQNGLRHGKGRVSYITGKVYEALWINGNCKGN